MGKYEKLFNLVLRGTSDKNIYFEDLRLLLVKLGFTEKIRGAHHNFRKTGIEEKINIRKMAIKQKLIK